ncbi:MAG: hypothetical protein LQ352_007304, partial [Teloschistes flavicans]
MPKDREKKALNPATAHLKSEKARALKKGKAAVSAQRTDRLASRNPFRLERQIGDLKALAGDGGSAGLGARDKKQLEELERQLGMVKKAREKVGDHRGFPPGGREEGSGGRGGAGAVGRGRGRGGGGYGGLGKRRRGEDARGESSGGGGDGSETDESVRGIPMPRDTPPPVPHSRGHHGRARGGGGGGGGFHRGSSTTTATAAAAGIHDHGQAAANANMEPLGEARGRVHGSQPLSGTTMTKTAKTTYEAKSAVRDLRKEAVRAFMPAAVARKMQAARGER